MAGILSNRDLFRDAIYVALWLYLFYNINTSVVKMLQSNISTALISMSASSMLYPSMTFCPQSNGLKVGTDTVMTVLMYYYLGLVKRYL